MKKILLFLFFLLINMSVWIYMYRFQFDLFIKHEIYVILTKFLPSVLTSFVSFLAAYFIFYKTKNKEDENKKSDQENIKKLLLISFSKKIISFKKIESQLSKFKEATDDSLDDFFIKKDNSNYTIFNKAIHDHLNYMDVFSDEKFMDKVNSRDLETLYNLCSEVNILVIRIKFILNVSTKSEMALLKKYINEFNCKIEDIESELKNFKNEPC